ncbi:Multidrug resistance transporter, Bcr/CflA family [hydrothermal vent metagenome]|uniref:Multidrug resistance transporter, Bcr/CflA family n=1 Tax=hydrothermal vent metagenome TaxID=652676 RepID=A0A3B1ALI0_9ZZZZ
MISSKTNKEFKIYCKIITFMDKPKTASHFWLIITLALLTMVGPFTIDTYLPSFPTIEAYYQVDRLMMSQSIAIYLIAAGISTLFWGALSDSIGRKIVIYGTLILYILASIGCVLSPEFSGFLFFRMLQGIAASGGMVVGRAIVRDAFDSAQAHRVMAYVMMVFAIAPAIAPIMGGYLQDSFGWKSVFYFLVAYGAIILLMSQRILPETLRDKDKVSFHPISVLRVYCRTLKNRRFQATIFTLGLSFAGMFLYISGSPAIIFDILQLRSNSFSYLFIPMTSGIVLGSFISGKLSHHLSATRIVTIAFGIMAVASLLNIAQLYLLQVSIFSVVAPLTLYAVGIAMHMPAITVLALDKFPQNRGSASAVQGFVQSLLATLVTAIIVPIIAFNLTNYVVAQVSFFVAALLLWLTICFNSD